MQSERCLRQRGDLPCIPHPRLQAFCRDTADDARCKPGRGGGSGLASRFAAETCPEIAAALARNPASSQARQSSAVRGPEPHRDADGGVDGLRTWGIAQKTSLGIRFPLASCAAKVEGAKKRGGRSVGPQGTPKGQSSLLRAAHPHPAGSLRLRTNSKQTDRQEISPLGVLDVPALLPSPHFSCS